MDFLRHFYTGLMGALMVSLLIFFLDVGDVIAYLKETPDLWVWAAGAFMTLLALFAWLSKLLAQRAVLRDGL